MRLVFTVATARLQDRNLYFVFCEFGAFDSGEPSITPSLRFKPQEERQQTSPRKL